MQSTNETRALAHEILAYWLRFNKHDQSSWVGDNNNLNITTQDLPTGAKVDVCGTTMCAAGTAVFLSKSSASFKLAAKNWGYYTWMEQGGELLGLDVDEAHDVFLSDNKSAKRFMRAIASGSQSKFDKAMEKRVPVSP